MHGASCISMAGYVPRELDKFFVIVLIYEDSLSLAGFDDLHILSSEAPQMRYRRLSEDGDYTFGNQVADFYKDSPDAVGQAVLTRLRLGRGEWFLDKAEGTPWDKVLGKYTSSTYDAAIRQRILGTQGVLEIAAYSSTLNSETRALSVNVTINTIYGTTTVQATL